LVGDLLTLMRSESALRKKKPDIKYQAYKRLNSAEISENW